MGKFFVAGILLGAAVTWAVMRFLVPTGLKGDVLEIHDENVRAKGIAEGKELANKDWQKRYNKELGAAKKKYEGRIEELEQRVRGLTGKNDELTRGLARTKGKLDASEKARTDAEQHIRELKEALGGISSAPKRLLVLRTSLGEMETKLWRRLGESAAVLGQALVGWPNVELASKAAKGISALAAERAKLARSVHVFVEQHSKELSGELGDLGPYRTGVQEADVKLVEKLAASIETAVKKLKDDTVTVVATKDGWVDTEIFVDRGDTIHVRAEGRWRMTHSWRPAGPEGWGSQGGQYKIAHDARAGALILQIGVSEKMHPAYLGKPIEAETSGRVKLRMNDKDVRDNAGKVQAHVVSGNPKTLRDVAELWEKVSGR